MAYRKSNSPDYSRYTVEELADVLTQIDQQKYPQRYAAAQSAYDEKLTDDVGDSPASEGEEESTAIPWSEQLLITRVMLVVFIGMMVSSVVLLFTDFLVSKRWASHTSAWVWLSTLGLSGLFYLSMLMDKRIQRRLVANPRGKFGFFIMPLVFLSVSWLFINSTLPLAVHLVLMDDQEIYRLEYRKAEGRKHCRHRLEVSETKVLEGGRLCVSSRLMASLREHGRMTVTVSQSDVGMLIHKLPED